MLPWVLETWLAWPNLDCLVQVVWLVAEGLEQDHSFHLKNSNLLIPIDPGLSLFLIPYQLII